MRCFCLLYVLVLCGGIVATAWLPANAQPISVRKSDGKTLIQAAAIDSSRNILVMAQMGKMQLSSWHFFDSKKPTAVYQWQTPDAVECVVFATAKNGERVFLSGDSRGVVRLWDIHARDQVDSFRAHRQQVLGLVFSQSANILVSLGIDDGKTKLRFWDLQTKKQTIPVRDAFGVSVALSPNGKLMALTLPGGKLELVEFPACKSVWTRSSGKAAWLSNVNFAPNGRTVITAESSWGKTTNICFWDVNSGSVTKKIAAYPIFDLGRRLVGGICCLSYSPTGLLVASAGKDDRVCFWEAATGQKITSVPGHQGPVNAILFHGDDDKCFSISHAGDVFFTDFAGIKKHVRPTANRKPGTDLQPFWQDLHSSEALRGVVAVEFFLQHSKLALPFLKSRLLVRKQKKGEWFSKNVNDLANANFGVRQKAAVEIEKQLYAAEPFLRQRLTNGTDLETRRRIENLLKKIPKLDGLRPADLRPLRVISILERIDAAESRELLAWMAKNLETEQLRSAAKRALGK
ncbi:MAG: hypothetical protein HYX68_12770 [Planctomycetes bacterium]|nr:hypothetical protein [Planctomycetota bacterium]